MPVPLLFLIADTGGGHRAGATAVARRLALDLPGEFEVSIVDPASAASPGVLGRTANLYGPLIQHGRWAWGALYHSTNSRAAVGGLRRTFLRPMLPVLEALLDRLRPAAVVSFHPLMNHAAAAAVSARAPGTPVITVITDLVDIHAGWACREVDAVVIPSPGGLDRCRRAGIPASRCHMLGPPVDSAFTRPPLTAAGRRGLRDSLGLDGERFTVLVCSGADGSGSIDRRARALAAADLDVDIVVICGRNQRAAARLEGLRDRQGRPIQVHGFVDNMADWMRAADVVVSKAGPGTISEALCTGLPLLLTWYLPGQERGNVEWVVDIGAGRYVPGLRELIDAVAELSEPGSVTLAAMREAVRAAARPDATERIAALVARMARRRPATVRSLVLPAVAEGACSVDRLRIFHFRNYEEQVVDLGQRLNLIGGRNAQGKTNLLEAVATVLLTRSPRASVAADVVRWHSDEALVEATVRRPAAGRTLAVRFRRDPTTGRVSRTASVDGSHRPARELLGLCPVVLFWPEDLQLVKAGPDGRRRLLDVLLSQLDARAATDLVRYRHILEQRNALLRQVRAGTSPESELAGFTAELVACGARIQVMRAELVRTLAPHAAAALDGISGGGETLGLRYLPDGGMDVDGDRAAAEEALLATLHRRREEELQRGLTLAGPHRDDLELLVAGRPARTAASQGQQRSIVLAVKLAEVRHIAQQAGVMPVLLLDDVLSELDPGRRRDLLAGLAEAGLQTLITSSEPLPDALPGGTRRFEVTAGSVADMGDR